MSDLLTGLLADLDAESEQLAAAVAGLGDDGWRRATPAAGWDVATTIAHLAWTDGAATAAARSVTEPEQKREWDAIVVAALGDPAGFVDRAAAELAVGSRTELLAGWEDGRRALREALVGVPEGHRLPWFGPPMSAPSMVTARLMETWAHAIDAYDALGSRPEPTDRIRAVAHLGVRTRDFAFLTRGEEPPGEAFRIDLTAPSGAAWAWGPEDAGQRISGSAYDLCLLVTQRIHRADTDLVAEGADADRWLDIAQVFAGPPGEGRARRG